MSENVAYLSRAWRDEAQKRLKVQLSPERMKNISTSMCSIYKNCPDGCENFLFAQYENGELTALEVGPGDPPEAEFIITGDYEVLARISRLELKSQVALMTGKLKLKGNMIKALRLATISDRFQSVVSQIPTDY